MDVGGATAEGSGEPLLVVQTALSLDDLVPLMQQPILRDRYRLITFNRRGYGDSRDVPWQASITQDARDCLAVLAAFDAAPAHVLGASYSAAVAMELAAMEPAAVRTLTVVEPPPVLTPAGPEFWAANAGLVEAYERDGDATVETFMSTLSGPGWRASFEQLVPGYAERLERDAATFFLRDIPSLMSWQYGKAQACQVTAPVLYVGGTSSGPWFQQTRAWVESLFDDVVSRMIDGAGHDLPLTHPQQLAETVVAFLEARSEQVRR